MAHKLMGNPTLSRGQIKPKEIARSQAMMHSAANASAGMRNQMHLDRFTNGGQKMWGYNDSDAHRWIRPEAVIDFDGRQGERVKWAQTGGTVGPVEQTASAKMGLAQMSTKDPQDHEFDKQLWYGKHYKNMLDLDGNKHMEDLGKQMLSSDFFAYLERKKELEFEKEYEMWKLNQVDLSTPANRTYWQTKMPELYQKKMEFYRIQAQLEAIRAEIYARGPQNQTDLYFMYLDGLKAFETADLDTINTYLENRHLDWLWYQATISGGLLKPGEYLYNTTKEKINSVPIGKA